MTDPSPAPTLLFETERLRCRQLEDRDLGAMLAVYGDRRAMRFVEDGKPLSEEGCRKWIEVTHTNVATRGYGMAALEHRATHEVVGFMGLVHPGGQDLPEIKYALHPDHWGQGLASEAARAMMAYGRDTHGMTCIIATVAPDHTASQRVLANAGLAPDGHRENDDGSRTLLYRWEAAPPA